ncbi:transglutaminase-like cysteine peptidase [Sphingomonas sp. CARO-RG-8B-R24-01]|uniref:transglutaminase-like cysteine peptidase n=1 Tax=Sphingomonas sp. CARO-RG-8B-R24-01 TaxID=2914831 RepID=UPI001F568A95
MVRIFGWVVGLAVLCANPVEAKPPQQPFLTLGAPADVPRGFVELCRSLQQVCDTLAGRPSLRLVGGSRPSLDTIGAGQLDQDQARMSLLQRIGARVNAHVRQQSDWATYGIGELWRPSGSGRSAVGDCEDIAIEKRLELVAAGFPPERLFFAIVFQSRVGLHTVLVARLDEGDMVLDSLSAFIEPWSKTRYQWLIAEYPGDPTRWRAIS